MESTPSPSDLEYEKAFTEWRKAFDTNCARIEAGDQSSSWQPMSTALKNGRPILVRSCPPWLDKPHMPFTVYYDVDGECWRDDSEDTVDFSEWGGGVESFTWHPLPEWRAASALNTS